MDVEDFQQAIDIEFEKLEGFHKQLKTKGISDGRREEVSLAFGWCDVPDDRLRRITGAVIADG